MPLRRPHIARFVAKTVPHAFQQTDFFGHRQGVERYLDGHVFLVSCLGMAVRPIPSEADRLSTLVRSGTTVMVRLSIGKSSVRRTSGRYSSRRAVFRQSRLGGSSAQPDTVPTKWRHESGTDQGRMTVVGPPSGSAGSAGQCRAGNPPLDPPADGGRRSPSLVLPGGIEGGFPWAQ